MRLKGEVCPEDMLVDVVKWLVWRIVEVVSCLLHRVKREREIERRREGEKERRREREQEEERDVSRE